MLTADLVRARVVRGTVQPDYVDPDDLTDRELAADLIAIFRRAVGKPRRDLDEDLKSLLGTGTEFLLHRGLAKLLLDRCTFGAETELEPEALRAAVFARSTAARRAGDFDRERVLRESAAALELDPATLERGLFADLKSEQLLQEYKGYAAATAQATTAPAPAASPATTHADEGPASDATERTDAASLEAEALLRRYNVALAQALLLRADSMQLKLPKLTKPQSRRLFRWIKFHRLLFTLEQAKNGSLTIQLDGPLSALRSSQRYGVQFALFLPRVLELPKYKVTALVRFGRGRKERPLKLSEEDGLRLAGKTPKEWIPEELRWLPDQLAKLTDEWDTELDTDPVDLGRQGVLVPDYTFTHKSSGRRVHMEVVGFWRKAVIASRVKLLRAHAKEDWILALSQDLRLEEGALDGLDEDLYLFRITPVARDVLKRLQAVIARPAR